MDEDKASRRAGRFHTTRWSVVLAAVDSGHPRSRRALGDLCETYWYPLYAYARRRGCDAEKARDLVQGFFSVLLEKRRLRVADPDRGRFRTFLLTALKNYMINEWERERAQKRGAGDEPISLDFDAAEGRYSMDPVDHRTPDRLYDRRWALTLLERTMGRLREEANRSAEPERFERLSRFLTGEDAGTTYKQVAADLGLSESAVKVAVHRMRGRFGELLREEVGQTVDDPGRVDAEIRYLFDVMET